MVFDVRQLVQSRTQSGSVTHDAGVLGHGVTKRALQGADILRTTGGQDLIDFISRYEHRGAASLLGTELR